MRWGLFRPNMCLSPRFLQGAKGTIHGKEKGDKKKPVSRSARAGLQFPVGRIHRLLKASSYSRKSWVQ